MKFKLNAEISLRKKAFNQFHRSGKITVGVLTVTVVSMALFLSVSLFCAARFNESFFALYVCKSYGLHYNRIGAKHLSAILE